jgi:hypothetical protein
VLHHLRGIADRFHRLLRALFLFFREVRGGNVKSGKLHRPERFIQIVCIAFKHVVGRRRDEPIMLLPGREYLDGLVPDENARAAAMAEGRKAWEELEMIAIPNAAKHDRSAGRHLLGDRPLCSIGCERRQARIIAESSCLSYAGRFAEIRRERLECWAMSSRAEIQNELSRTAPVR